MKLDFIPESGNYNFTTPETVLSATLEGGKSRRRATVKNATSQINVQWVLDADEYRSFTAFYVNTLNEGVDEFEIDLISYEGLVEHTASFVDGFNLTGVRGFSRVVSANLEVTPISDIVANELILLYPPGDLAKVVNRFETLLNVQIPTVTQ